jgi:hypothetical protein
VAKLGGPPSQEVDGQESVGMAQVEPVERRHHVGQGKAGVGP